MTDRTYPELDEADSIVGTEEIAIFQDGRLVQLTLAELAEWIKVAETIVPSIAPYRGARVVRTSNVTVSGVQVVAWQASQRDTDSFWSAGAPTRLTVPAGVSKVRVGAMGRLTSAGTAFQVTTLKNGAAYAGLGTQTSDQQDTGCWSDVLDVVEGDYFEVQLFTGASRTLEAVTSGVARTWFAMQVVEES
jgi:hypothetical protein